MYNRNFGKPTAELKLEYAPKPLIIDGAKVWTDRDDYHNSLGWYRILRTDVPTREGYYYTEYWQIVDNRCKQMWEEHQEEPETDE